MGANFIKNIFCIGTVFLLASMSIFLPITNSQNLTGLEKNQPLKQNEETDTVTYTFSLTAGNKENHQKGHTIYEVNLSKNKAIELSQKIQTVDSKFSNIKNPKELEKITEEKIEILRNYDILPASFSLENLSKLTREIGEQITGRKEKSRTPFTSDDNGFLPYFGVPYLSIGPSVFAYCCPVGQVWPFGVSPVGLSGLNITKLVNVDIRLNSSGIYIESNGPILQDRKWEIDGPLWNGFWAHRNISSINYSEAHVLGFYYGEIIFGHTLAFGFAYPDYMNFPKPRAIIGSFYYLGSINFPLTFTLYRDYPEPTAILLDVGIVPSLFSSVILPFWYTDRIG